MKIFPDLLTAAATSFASAALLGGVHFILLWALYSMPGWGEIRVLAPYFIFMMVFLVAENGWSKYVLGAILIPMVYNAEPVSKEWMSERNSIPKAEQEKQKEIFREIASVVPGGSRVFIEYDQPDHSLDLLNLPLTSASGGMIKYVIRNCCLKPEIVDFALCRTPPLPQSYIWNEYSTSLITENGNFSLFKLSARAAP